MVEVSKEVIFQSLARLFSLLSKRSLMIATAESCTGGLVGSFLTELPGSSQYYSGGVIAYSDAVKTTLLKVPKAVIDEKGAVSPEVAHLMAEGAANAFNVSLSISVTGIAGPTGGTETKPVGTIYCGFKVFQKTVTHRFNFSGNRNQVRMQTVLSCLNKMVDILEESHT
ncbi:MAG: CinA family protein [Oligoflexales bacterium]